MARESKTVQVYPDDTIVNNTIAEYESFGWELVTNQRCQEFTGQTQYSDGGRTNHYSTFNKLTFSREKSSAWYNDVIVLENKLANIRKERNEIKNARPAEPQKSLASSLIWILRISFKKKKKQYEQDLQNWQAKYSARLKELDEEEYETIQKASEIVNG